MNIMTFDIEEWVIESHKYNRKERYILYDEILDRILYRLHENGIKATFFCLGEMARKFPYVIQKIASFGHEIGCHSDAHIWLNKLSRTDVEEDTYRAISSLEDLIGQKIKSYRAPAFSVGESNTWAFEILANNGIEYDSSVFPAKRDFGGFPSFVSNHPILICTNEYLIKEFPIPQIKTIGQQIAFSGGGYFRIMPLFITKHQIVNRDYLMFYFHINDFIAEQKSFMTKQEYELYFKEKGTFTSRFKRYVKANITFGDTMKKISNLMCGYDFCCLEDAAHRVDWTNSKKYIVQ